MKSTKQKTIADRVILCSIPLEKRKRDWGNYKEQQTYIFSVATVCIQRIYFFELIKINFTFCYVCV